MKVVSTLALTLTAVACLAQSKQIILDGERMKSTIGPALQNLLGADYVIAYAIRSGHDGQKPPITLWITDPTPPEDQWAEWTRTEDGFVASLKFFFRVKLNEIRKPEQFRILLPPITGNATYTEDFVPLVKQIARENHVEVIDLSKSTDPAKDLYLQLATFQRNPGTWRLVSATSEQTDEGPAKNAIDNNPDTYWHTRYDPNPTKVPHEIIIDLGKTQSLNGFSYLARQDGGVNGRVKDFEIYVSDDQTNWGEPALKGTLQNSMNEQRLLFPKTATGRYLKFKALTEVNGNVWTSIAELGILPTGKPK